MQFIRVKNWEKFQHYKDRSAPWIKLYRDMMDSAFWVMGSDASKLLATCTMLLAVRNDNKIPLDEAYIQRVCHLGKAPDFSELLKYEFIEFINENGECLQDASTVLAMCTPEKNREEERREDSMSGKPDALPPSKLNGKKAEAVEVLNFLNEKAGRAYRPTEANLGFIVARFKEGATVSDCRKVIAKKCREWATDEKMAEFLRPATLFNRQKFDQYIGEIVPQGGLNG